MRGLFSWTEGATTCGVGRAMLCGGGCVCVWAGGRDAVVDVAVLRVGATGLATGFVVRFGSSLLRSAAFFFSLEGGGFGAVSISFFGMVGTASAGGVVVVSTTGAATPD
jgi:hypothetical protein